MIMLTGERNVLLSTDHSTVHAVQFNSSSLAHMMNMKNKFQLLTDEKDSTVTLNVHPLCLEGKIVPQWIFELKSVLATAENRHLKGHMQMVKLILKLTFNFLFHVLTIILHVQLSKL
jgi:hypothetical protein